MTDSVNFVVPDTQIEELIQQSIRNANLQPRRLEESECEIMLTADFLCKICRGILKDPLYCKRCLVSMCKSCLVD